MNKPQEVEQPYEVLYNEQGEPEMVFLSNEAAGMTGASGTSGHSSKPPESEEKENTYYKEWVERRPNEFIPTPPIVKRAAIPPGSYTIAWDYQNGNPIFTKRPVKLDELLMLPDPVFKSILSDIQYFWDNKKRFEEYKFVYKRGILLYGPPGSGKTSLIALLSNDIISRGGVIINITEAQDLKIYNDSVGKIFRNIQPDTPVLTIMEDLDGLVGSKEIETLLLNTLDGVRQLTNVVYLACTNYPENLEARILNRPSRFDKRYFISLPSSEVRKFYLERKIHPEDLKKLDLDDIVKQTEGLSMAHLGEFVKSTCIFGKTVEESLASLKKMGEYLSSTKFNQKKTGF
jgi:GTPase SAR1 family protein